MLHLLHVFWALTFIVPTTSGQQQTVRLSALDCRHPKKAIYSLKRKICNVTTDQITEQPPQPVMIVTQARTQELRAFRCEKSVTTMTSICGAYSHNKLIAPPDILRPTPVSEDECRTAATAGFVSTEAGKTIPIKPDTTISYKLVPIGQLDFQTNNVYCTGGTAVLQGRTHTDLIQFKTVRFTLQVVTLEHDLEREALVDLDLHSPLKYACIKDLMCTVSTYTYFIPAPPPSCGMYPVRNIPMSEVYVPIQNGTSFQRAMVSHPHKVFLEEMEDVDVPAECQALGLRGRYTRTNVDGIYLLKSASMINVFSEIATFLPPSSVSMDTEVRTTGEYIEYTLESQLQRKLKLMHNTICTMSSEQLVQQEMSPFATDSIIRVRGDVLQHMQCSRVNITLAVGSQTSRFCYDNAIPVQFGPEKLLVHGDTRQLIELAEATQVPCDSTLSPIFEDSSSSVLFTADPIVKIVDIPIVEVNLDALHLRDLTDGISHDQWLTDIFYSSSEIRGYNNLIHFERVKENIMSQVTQRYCSSADCGSYRGPSSDLTSFDISHLEQQVQDFSWTDALLQPLYKAGNISSLFMLMYVIVKAVYFIVKNRQFNLCNISLAQVRASPLPQVPAKKSELEALNSVVEEELIELPPIYRASTRSPPPTVNLDPPTAPVPPTLVQIPPVTVQQPLVAPAPSQPAASLIAPPAYPSLPPQTPAVNISRLF